MWKAFRKSTYKYLYIHTFYVYILLCLFTFFFLLKWFSTHFFAFKNFYVSGNFAKFLKCSENHNEFCAIGLLSQPKCVWMFMLNDKLIDWKESPFLIANIFIRLCAIDNWITKDSVSPLQLCDEKMHLNLLRK